MAIYHLTASAGSRAGGAVAAMRYDYIAREGRYERDAEEVREVESGNMPEWAAERPRLYWEEADAHERANGRLFREIHAPMHAPSPPSTRIEYVWNAALSDHTPIEITTTNGSVSMRIPEDYDLLASIHGTPSGHIVLQYAHRRAGTGHLLRTYLVDSATGVGALIGNDLPSIKFIGPESYVTAFSDPYPRIEVRVVEGWGWLP